MNHPEFLAATGRIAGIDYGTVRIGVAITDVEQRWAGPWAVYRRSSAAADAVYFRDLQRIEQVTGFVVGLPIHLSGDESGKSQEARQFGAWIRELTQVPVVFFDERFSTREAEMLLSERGRMPKKKRQARLDALAAQVLLQAYLESAASSRNRSDAKARGNLP